jgi:regulator of protease activity HflC (stomatin/prohibitin superfamily)
VQEATKNSPGLNLIKLVVNVQYRVRPGELAKYLGYTDGRKMMESLASREMVEYCASATLDTPVGKDEADRPEAIMTYGRAKAAAELQKRIQAAAQKADLGVDVLFVGLQAVHPPKDVVPDDEKVLETERRMEMMRYEAQADANRTLARAAGDTETARLLALAIRKLNDLESLRDLTQATDLPAKLADTLRRIRDDVKSLEKDVDQERLMGRLSVELTSAGAPAEQALLTLQQRMLKVYQGYVDQLTALEAVVGKPAEFKAGLDEKIAQVGNEADTLLRRALGEPATIVAQAQSARWSQELAERAAAEVFEQNVLAYQASPRVYMQDRWLDVWDVAMPRMVKYVLAVDRNKLEIWLNWELTKGAMSGVDFVPTEIPR